MQASGTSDARSHGAHGAATPLVARGSRPLSGRARMPGDKSISHRALLLGLLTVGRSEVEGLLEGEDVLATLRACRALGAAAERTGPGAYRIRAAGIGTLLQPSETLDFGNAGTGARLTMGVVAGHGIDARFDGDASLRRRPMRRVLDPLLRMGAEIVESDDGRLPLLLRGARDPL